MRKNVTVTMALGAIQQTELALVQKVGQEILARNAYAQTISTARIVKTRANAKRKIQRCATRGLGNVIVKPVGAAIDAIAHAHTSSTVKTVQIIASVRIVRNARPLMDHVRAHKVSRGKYATNLVLKAPTAKIVRKSVSVPMERLAAQKPDNVSAQSAGKVIYAIVRVILALSAGIVSKNAIVSMQESVIHKLVNAHAAPVGWGNDVKLNVSSGILG